MIKKAKIGSWLAICSILELGSENEAKSGSLTFPHVAHATLEGLRRVSICADAAVPEVLLDHLRLPLLSSHRRGFLVHNTGGEEERLGAAGVTAIQSNRTKTNPMKMPDFSLCHRLCLCPPLCWSAAAAGRVPVMFGCSARTFATLTHTRWPQWRFAALLARICCLIGAFSVAFCCEKNFLQLSFWLRQHCHIVEVLNARLSIFR